MRPTNRFSGIKRHIVVDTQGLLHAIAVTTADVTDRQGALMAIDQHVANLSAVTALLVDGGYTGKSFAESVQTLIGAEVQVAKRHELPAFAVMPQCWVAEWSFAWLEKCRRLWKNTERLLNTSLQFVNLAFLALLLRRY
jgi:transposase